MKMRKTSVWVSRSLGLLFVFSSFGHLAEANSSKSQVVQKGTTSRMATIGRFCKKHWYVAIPVMSAAGYVAYRFKYNSTEQKNESNSAVRKPKSEQSGAAQEETQQSTNSSVDAQEEKLPENLIVLGDGTTKPSESTESLTSDNDSVWWQNPQNIVAWLKNLDNPVDRLLEQENVVKTGAKVVAAGIVFKLVYLVLR